MLDRRRIEGERYGIEAFERRPLAKKIGECSDLYPQFAAMLAERCTTMRMLGPRSRCHRFARRALNGLACGDGRFGDAARITVGGLHAQKARTGKCGQCLGAEYFVAGQERDALFGEPAVEPRLADFVGIERDARERSAVDRVRQNAPALRARDSRS